VLLGVILSVAQFKNWDVVTIFLSWWPFILIVLGSEILIYLFASKQEGAMIKYDFLSVIFIGLLGTVALSFMLLTVSGLLDEIRYSVSTNEETFDLPSYTETLPSHIEKIVLDTDDQPIRLEGSNGHAIQVFGTYRTSRSDEMNPLINKKEDFI